MEHLNFCINRTEFRGCGNASPLASTRVAGWLAFSHIQTSKITRSSANAEEPCEHTVSWNRVKCCTNFRRIALENAYDLTVKIIQSHCRCCHLIGHIGLTISYLSSIVSISLSCTVFEILPLICQKLRRHIRSTRPTWGQFVITRLIILVPTHAQNLMFLSSDIPEKFKGCKILKWITWPGPRPFQGCSVVRRLTLNIAW